MWFKLKNRKQNKKAVKQYLKKQASYESGFFYVPQYNRNMKRCAWVPMDKPLYVQYHDEEWGVPVHDDRELFEMLILEGAHAGLSWWTVLQKRDTYRAAFDNFYAEKVAAYGEEKIADLLQDRGIVRNKLKVRSAVRNAKVFIEIKKEWGSFDAYLWHWVDGKTIHNDITCRDDVVATSSLSDAISKDLKKRGMNFVGSTIIYAYLQAVGVVNDHENDCFCNPKNNIK